LPKIDDLIGEAKKLGLESLALTDNGNLYGAIEFYKACKAKGIKPIIGVDFYVAARSRKDMQAGIDNRRTRLVLLAMNETGYKNLVQLVTKSNLEGFYYKPRIDRELLELHNEGLIAISPSFSGEIAQSLKSRSQDKAKEVAEFYKRVFGTNEEDAKKQRSVPPERLSEGAKATEKEVSAEHSRTPFAEEVHVPATPFSRYRIRFGLVTIKNFGQGISSAIIDERKNGGSFTSIANFLDRVKDKNLNKKSMESLIKTGAFDCFGEDRGVLLANLDLMLDYNKENSAQHADQDSLFGGMTDTSSVPTLRLIQTPLAEMRDKLAWEKELLGLYISGHPLERYRDVITKNGIDIKKAFETIKEGGSTIFAGIINEVRAIQTKKNETMAFVTISDFSGSSEAVVFPRVYKEFHALIVPDRCVAVKATINTRNGEKNFIIERVKGL